MAQRFGGVKLAGVLVGVLAGAPALAQTSGTNQPVFVWTHEDLTITGNLIAAAASVNTQNAGFGTGSWRIDGTRIGTNVAGLEVFAKPQLVGLYDPGPYSLYSRVSLGVGATLSGGDAYFPYNASVNRPSKVLPEEAMAGVRSGTSFMDWGVSNAPDIFDLSVGNQDFYVGDGFLIQQGGANGGRRGAYWAGQRTAFRNTAILRINTQPVRADLFELQTNYSQYDAYWPTVGSYPSTGIAGINVEYYADSTKDGAVTKDWSYGIALMHVYDSDINETFGASTGAARADGGTIPGAATGATRNGMNVLDLRAQGTLVHSLPDLFLSGEFVYENNPSGALTENGFAKQLNAMAYYGEASWWFSGGGVPWKPKVGVRVAHFSGQNPNSAHSTAFDPLMYGYSYAPSRNTYGTWIMGEIVGEYYLFNSNEDVGMVYVTATPTDEITLSAFLYDFRFDQAPSAAVTSKAAFREVDLEADYYPTRYPWFGLTGIAGLAQAGAGGRQYIDNTVSLTASNPSDIRAAGRTQALFLLTVQLTF